jgi:hypothetical protein
MRRRRLVLLAVALDALCGGIGLLLTGTAAEASPSAPAAVVRYAPGPTGACYAMRLLPDGAWLAEGRAAAEHCSSLPHAD